MRFVFGALLVIFAAAPIHACSCITPTPKSAFKASSAVFVGEVVKYDQNLATMRVVEWFKGPRTSTIVIRTGTDGAACGYGGALAAGSRHVIYAWGPAFEVGLCGRSSLFDSARAQCDLALLRSRAAWWRSPLSSPRILERLGVRRAVCVDG